MTLSHLKAGRFAAVLLSAGLSLASGAAFAFDTGGGDTGGNSGGGGTSTHTATPAGPSLADARALIAAKKWADAVDTLKQIVATDSSSADAYNLLGYSYRNLGKYDLAGKAYARALALDPKHTGALEYQGVLFLKLGEPDKAKANLARIKAICGTTCEEYQDLKKAIG